MNRGFAAMLACALAAGCSGAETDRAIADASASDREGVATGNTDADHPSDGRDGSSWDATPDEAISHGGRADGAGDLGIDAMDDVPNRDAGRDAISDRASADEQETGRDAAVDRASSDNRDSSTDRQADAGAAVDTGVADGATSCDPPPALLVPDSDVGEQPYDVAMARSSAGIGVIWSKWPSGYRPQFTVYDPSSRSFTPSVLLGPNEARSAEHVALTTLPDGRFAAAWVVDGGLSPSSLYVSVGPETASPVVVDLSPFEGLRQPVPSVGIAPLGQDRLAVAWAALASGTDDPVIDVQIADLSLNRIKLLEVAPLDTGPWSAEVFANGDDLFLIISQVITNNRYDLSFAKIAASDAGAPDLAITPPKRLMTLDSAPSNFALAPAALSFAYVSGPDLVFGSFDLDGNPIGSPQPIMPKTNDATRLAWDGSAYHLLWRVPDANYGTAYYAKLDGNHQPISPVILGNQNVPVPFGALKAGSSVIAGWYTTKAVFLSPICP